MAAELGRAGAGRDQHGGQGTRAAAQFARQLECHRGPHAMAEKRESAVEVGIDVVGQRGHQRAHALEGRFGEARFAARQADGDGRPAG